jgi:hypothetical protein
MKCKQCGDNLAILLIAFTKFQICGFVHKVANHKKAVNLMQYKIEITFTANQELTNGELADLESAISLQLEEPTDYDQNDVSYQTSQINYKMEEVK